jgi:pre-mRNA-splicing factor ATP-dependent RNA helicase DHX16
MGILKDAMLAREDLKVIISSATLDAKKFSDYFDAPIFYVEGRTFPVEVLHCSTPEADYLAAATTTVFQIHTSQPLPGDILVFLTGQEDIDLAEQNITETARKLGNRIPELVVAPIYAALPTELQAKIFEPTPPGARKVIIATNIAETSITVPGVRYVIDSGLAKENVYNPTTGVESLQVVPISRANAEQRAGRAGRVGPGTCLRLYTKYSYYNELESSITPDILRSNLTQTVLLMMSLNIPNIIDFDWLDSPSPDSLIKSLETLYQLGAISSAGVITKLGRQIVEFPTDVELAAALIASKKYECTQEVLTIVAMLGESANLFYRPKDQKVHADSARARFTSQEGGDHLTLLNVYEQWAYAEYSKHFAQENFVQYRSLQRARLVKEQLEQLCERVDIPLTSGGTTNHVPILKSILAGYFAHTAVLTRDGHHYRTLKSNLTVRIHPSSVLAVDGMKPKVIMFHEVVQTSADWMRQCAPIESAWVGEVAPHFYKSGEVEKHVGNKERKMPKGKGMAAGSNGVRAAPRGVKA